MPAKKNNQVNSFDHFRGNEKLIERLSDLMDQVERSYQPMITSFLTPLEQDVAKRFIGNRFSYQLYGGYEGAENCRLKLFPIYQEMDSDLEIVTLKAKLHPRYDHITHRDVLGAMMKLGIERDVFGDILVREDALYLYVSKHMAEYFMLSLNRVRHTNIHLEVSNEVLEVKQDYQEFHHVVASLRLDVIISACIRVSRVKAKEMIQKGLVKINHVVLEQCDRICNNNSTISIRGYGRFTYVETTHITKKGNYVVVIRKLR